MDSKQYVVLRDVVLEENNPEQRTMVVSIPIEAITREDTEAIRRLFGPLASEAYILNKSANLLKHIGREDD